MYTFWLYTHTHTRVGICIHLICVDALGHGPCGHNEVHHPLTQAPGHLVELQEVPHVVQHLVVAVGVGVHLLEDGGDVSKYGRIEQGWNGGKRVNVFLK